jgi:Arm DNA-binding domain
MVKKARAGRTQKARKLTPQFVETAKDGDWPDTLAVGLALCVSNGGEGKSWEYRYTSPTRFKETTKDGKLKRKYKRRQKGLGSAKAAKGGVSLAEARAVAVLLANDVRNGIDPIDAAEQAKLSNEVRTGEALTVADAIVNFREVDIDHRPFSYRKNSRTFHNRILKGLGPIPIRTLEQTPALIVDRLVMRERWTKHRSQEEKLLSYLYRAIESVRGRCKITRNPAVIKGCLEYCGLPQRRAKPKGRYKAAAFKDAPRIMELIQSEVNRGPRGGFVSIGERPTSSYLLEFILRSGVRSQEARLMQYKELNEAKQFWLASFEHLKKSKDGSACERPIKLTPGLQAIIDAVKSRRVDQSDDAYVFPSPLARKRGQPHTQGALDRLIKKLWPAMNVHGGRATMRIWGEANKLPLNLIDRQQGRREAGVGPTHYSIDGRPYLEDHTFEPRGDIAQQWESFCDQKATHNNGN